MRINADLVLALRQKKSWSQEELAIAAGLNLRTIQRVEKEASASMQTKKALASALDIDLQDLDFMEVAKTRRYEYKLLEIESGEGFLAGIRKAKVPDLAKLLNEEGQHGWLVVQILTPELAQGIWSGKTGRLVALLQREIAVG